MTYLKGQTDFLIISKDTKTERNIDLKQSNKVVSAQSVLESSKIRGAFDSETQQSLVLI